MMPTVLDRAVRRYGWRRAATKVPKSLVRRARRRLDEVVEQRPWSRTAAAIRHGGFTLDQAMVVSDPVYGTQMIRKGTTDWPTFNQVFVREDYAFDHTPPRTIIDLGANVGYAAVYYHRRFPEARIVAIEPSHENVVAAEVNVALAGAGRAIDVVESAIWHSPSRLRITNPGANAWAYRVAEAEPNDESAFGATTMPMLMDEFGFETVDLVKIDIEAAERYLFEKNTEWLDHVNEIVIELHDRFTKGCREPVVAALDRHFGEYDEITKGENTLFRRTRPLVSSAAG